MSSSSVSLQAPAAAAAAAASPAAPIAAAAASDAAPPPSLADRKRKLRSSMGAALDRLTHEQLHSRSAALATRLLASPLYANSGALCLFVSMPRGEVQTEAMLKHALDAGKRVYVPRIASEKPAVAASSAAAANVAPVAPAVPAAPGRMRMLRLHSMEDLSSWQPNRWGIREPPLLFEGQPRVEAQDDALLDLIVCPGVAFDAGCRRLGHGKGYYDSWLASLFSTRAADQPRVRMVAIGFDEQIVEEVPVGDTDVPLDEVITPNKHFRAQR